MGIGWQRRIRSDPEYVRFASYYLRRCGFFNVRPPEEGFAPGVDLLAVKKGKRYAVICRNLTQPEELVQSEAVYEAMSAMRRHRCAAAVVISNRDVTHGAWVLADENNVEMMLGISPETAGIPLRQKDIITQKNVVAFAVGCVAFGIWFSRIYPHDGVSLSAYVIMAIMCMVLSWVACSVLMMMWRNWRYG